MAISNNIKKVIGIITILPFFIYVISQIAASSDELRSFQWRLAIHWMILGLFLLVAANSFACLLWHFIVCRLGVRMNFSDAFYIWNISRLGRFIPGNIWQYLGRIYLSKNFNKTIIIWSTGIETALEILKGFFLAGLGIIFLNYSVYSFFPAHISILIGIGVALSLIVLHPTVTKWILNKFRYNINEIEIPEFSELLKWFILYIGLWVVRITAYWSIIHSFGITIGWLNLAGIFSISWVLGMIAPFAPGGIGVREGIMTFLLTPVLGSGFASVVSILIRASEMVGEGITVVIAILVNRKSIQGGH